ncbi:MAG: hypothetical protein A2908_04740 [Candidatus Staskawiczbacteria bacterium RIFCSPLOWO2_01_FULL_38_12b]|uniref:Thioredoxin domain-containing protein n=1 Tax=Candidatus Staskawiczbacteria bacterium RIFCSPLOWO2_01_FULL_38_12b TaxID=1802214 RepID=A0A1G2IHJ5_9BACT|nr:MAG: hypothetical protein A2908_04740 [Candidatus Staskawiczbacteria bacterium RIFCSPLOWO2_01_FULL_38_12b]
MNKNIIFALALVIVLGVIGYIQITKPKLYSVGSGNAESIALAPSSDKVLDTSTTASPALAKTRMMNIEEKAKKYSPAVEIIPGGQFINAEPFTLKSLIGKKVILVDFWTYTCINCQRTTPYLKEWYRKYKDQGLIIVGVHTPEFEFEKEYSNVKKAVEDEGILYPVVQDNNYATWSAYGNRYWPHKYLIDIDGFIVHDKIGEGGYDEFEKAIQKALAERNLVLGLKNSVDINIANPKDVIIMDSSKVQSPETYFGSARNEYLGNGKKSTSGNQVLSFPDNLSVNKLYLDGTWDFQNEFAESKSATAKIKFLYNAKNVYLVASSDEGVTVKIFQDGALIKTMTIKDHRLYNIVEGTDYGKHTLEIEIDRAGLKAFAFTFG